MAPPPLRSRASVVLAWCGDPLVVGVVTPDREFRVGPNPRCADFVIPGRTSASVRVEGSGSTTLRLSTEAAPMPRLRGASKLLGGGALELRLGDAVSVRLGELTLSVCCEREDSVPSLRRSNRAGWLEVTLALATVACGSMAWAETPTWAATRAAALSVGVGTKQGFVAKWRSAGWQLAGLGWPVAAPPPPEVETGAMIFAESPSRETASVRPRSAGVVVPVERADQRQGGDGRRAKWSEGPIGNPWAWPGQLAWTVAARRPISPPHAARESDAAAWHFAVGARPEPYIINERVESPFGEPEPDGEDPIDVVGNMFGEPGDPEGAGLGASGRGPGGGGKWRGIGLGALGRLGHGDGGAKAQGSGVLEAASPFARRAGLGEHAPAAPQLSKRVDTESVERALARESGRLRSCVGSGPVEVTLTLGASGSVTRVQPRASTPLPKLAIECVMRVVAPLRLPVSDAGVRITLRLP